MKVCWTDTAEGHLDAIYAFIAKDSKIYAIKTISRITARSMQIGSFPFSGRQVPEYDMDQIREVYERPYRIIYYINAEQIDVIAVIHDAQNVLADTAE